VVYSGCCTHFFTWYLSAIKPGSLRFTAPNMTSTGGFLYHADVLGLIIGLCWWNHCVLI
jgi:hypothetical protein